MPRLSVAPCLVALSTVVCGCGALDSGPAVSPHPGSALILDYRAPLRLPALPKVEAYERSKPELDIAGGRVFVGSSDRGLYALVASSGKTLWRFETLGPVQSEPLYAANEGAVYFGSNDGALYKVRASDGELLWRFFSASEVTRKPVLSDGALYFVSANDTALSVDATTGKLLWSRQRTPIYGMEISGHAGVTVHQGRVYAAFSDGTVHCFNAKTGADLWPTVDLGEDAEQILGKRPRFFDVDSTPVLLDVNTAARGGPFVAVAQYSSGVYALDSMGSRGWVNSDARGMVSLTLLEAEGGDVLVATGPGGVWGLDPATGVTRWKRELPEGGATEAAPLSGAILVGTTRYGLFLFAGSNGALLDAIEPGGNFAAPPNGFGRRAFAMSTEGILYGLTIRPPQ